MEVVLGIDQGSSSTKVLALDGHREVLARGAHPLGSSLPEEGRVEFDPMALWDSVERAVGQCLAALPPSASVVAVGVANQRESAVAWDRRTAEPSGPGISWQDRRGASYCEAAEQRVGAAKVRDLTGLALDTSSSACKLRWLLDRVGRRPGTVVGTVDSWLVARLSPGGPHRCEIGNASRTGLFDLSTLSWAPVLLEAFGVPEETLPEVRPSVGDLGACHGIGGLEEARLVALCGDSHAALFSHHARDGATMKATYGTGSSVVSLPAAAGRERPGEEDTRAGGAVASEGGAHGLLARSVVWQLDAVQLASEGNVLSAGSALRWMAGLLGLGSVAELERVASRAQVGSEVTVVPALSGLGAPWLAPGARAQIEGLTERSGPAEVALGVFEAVAQLVADIAELMRPSTELPRDGLHVDGGASRSDLLMQLQADLLGMPVVRPRELGASGLGAAYLAGLGGQLWSAEDLAEPAPDAAVFEPRISADERAERRRRWRAAAARCAGSASIG